MLKIIVPANEFWNEKEQRFEYIASEELNLEHSLISISKWESKWHIPFLNDGKRIEKFKKTPEMIRDYVRCMCVNKLQDPRILYCLTNDNMKAINDYINDPMTATSFADRPTDPNQIVARTSNYTTNEIIYYQMVELGIPLEWEKRHLNRLLTLIRVVSEKKAEANDPKRAGKNTGSQYRTPHIPKSRPHIPRR